RRLDERGRRVRGIRRRVLLPGHLPLSRGTPGERVPRTLPRRRRRGCGAPVVLEPRGGEARGSRSGRLAATLPRAGPDGAPVAGHAGALPRVRAESSLRRIRMSDEQRVPNPPPNASTRPPDVPPPAPPLGR